MLYLYKCLLNVGYMIYAYKWTRCTTLVSVVPGVSSGMSLRSPKDSNGCQSRIVTDQDSTSTQITTKVLNHTPNSPNGLSHPAGRWPRSWWRSSVYNAGWLVQRLPIDGAALVKKSPPKPQVFQLQGHVPLPCSVSRSVECLKAKSAKCCASQSNYGQERLSLLPAQRRCSIRLRTETPWRTLHEKRSACKGWSSSTWWSRENDGVGPSKKTRNS